MPLKLLTLEHDAKQIVLDHEFVYKVVGEVVGNEESFIITKTNQITPFIKECSHVTKH